MERDGVGIAFTKYGVHYAEVMRYLGLKDTITICVTRPVTESTMTAVPVFRRADVPVKVNSDYDDIFRGYLCCLLIKQAPKLILGLIGAASLRNIRREVVESLLAATTIFINRSLKRSTLTIESHNRSETIIPTPLVVLGLLQRTTLKPCPISLGLRQDHLVSCTAHKPTLQRSSASTNSHERPVNVPAFSVATRVLLTLRDFRTSSVAPRCRPRKSCLRYGTFGLAQLPPMPSSHQGPSHLTLRDFRTSSVAPRCRPRIRDPRILLTLTGLCECPALADAVALSR
ncbi:unnamed protein product [Heligmosomoides polygyrus]|uniref:ANF_receptor domain-containing protein n=1 Tax=Heligmosomoides polygyrus TaxID=6339 RepID=A0A183FXH3_HELPZ|nr:unnamed protein product [Heligmosomoides polygyrus]